MPERKIIDISLSLKPAMIAYPGNPEFEISRVQDIDCGASSNVSKITLGSHTGTHIDAPLHSIKNGAPIERLSLDCFFGPSRVIDATNEEGSVSLSFVESKGIQKRERILFKTKNSLLGFDTWRDDFVFLSPEASEYLAKLEVALVGIDYLSIKQKGSKDNRPHTEFLSLNIPILEGIDLSLAEEGEYILAALPLKIENGDGAPARAVLIAK
ncbi:MAG TPA: cyclase family protein [Candidatus Paceibacterota bacterium]|nr:cyclase family protein [Candidatus Paceibacterota bacterium]